MTGRPTNQQLCAEFRALLTEGAKANAELVVKAIERNPDPIPLDNFMALTKPWRGEVWKAFRELENRLCPQPPAKHD